MDKGFIITQTRPIFVAVPEDWRHHIESWLIEEDYLVELALSRDDAIRVLNPPTWGGFIVIADWVFDELESPGLIERLKGKMPTLTIVTKEVVEKFGLGPIIDKVYLSAMHQFCTAPFSAEELIMLFRRAKDAFEATQDK